MEGQNFWMGFSSIGLRSLEGVHRCLNNMHLVIISATSGHYIARTLDFANPEKKQFKADIIFLCYFPSSSFFFLNSSGFPYAFLIFPSSFFPPLYAPLDCNPKWDECLY